MCLSLVEKKKRWAVATLLPFSSCSRVAQSPAPILCRLRADPRRTVLGRPSLYQGVESWSVGGALHLRTRMDECGVVIRTPLPLPHVHTCTRPMLRVPRRRRRTLQHFLLVNLSYTTAIKQNKTRYRRIQPVLSPSLYPHHGAGTERAS